MYGFCGDYSVRRAAVCRILEEQLSGEGYKVLPDGKIRIVNPKQDIEVYSRLAAEHGIFIRELTENRHLWKRIT